MRSDLLNTPVYKFSGRIEHWLTTYHRGFWGLPDGEQSKWESISAGDVFLFHGTKTEYINDNDAGGGVITLYLRHRKYSYDSLVPTGK